MLDKGLVALALSSYALPCAAQSTEAFFDSNGVKIRYVVAGEGVPVVLIHGWMSDSSMWGSDGKGNTKLDSEGAKGFQLIAMDCRGHGKSDKPHDSAKYGPEMAEDVVRLLDNLKIAKAHLVGYSSGAYIVGKVVATHPNRVLSAVYGGQAPIFVGAPASDFSQVYAFAKAVEEGKGLGPYLIEVTPKDRPKPTLESANAIAKLMFAGKDVEAYAAAGKSFISLAVEPDALAKAKVPTLLIYGANESQHVKDRVAATRRVLPDAQVKAVEGGDHMTTLIKPEFGASILEFLRSVGLPLSLTVARTHD